MLWIAFFLSVITAFLVTRLSIIVSNRRGILDIPNPRSSHSQPVPRLGGIGILAAALIVIAVLSAAESVGWLSSSLATRDIGILLLAGVVMAAAGLYDDFRGLRPAVKFLMQFLIAGWIVMSGFRIETFAVLNWGPFPLGFLAVPVTILWLTGFANIFNFMDGINGIAGLSAATYFAFFAVIARGQGQTALATVAIILAGSCVGFIPNNFPNAKTFMGDTGSLLLGITLAFYVVLLAQTANEPATLVALVLVCSVYLWDGVFTLLRRLWRGENIFQAHRSHLYQRLTQAGQSHARITVLYFILHLLLGFLALSYLKGGLAWKAAVLVLAILALIGLTLAVHQLERRAARVAPDFNRAGSGH